MPTAAVDFVNAWRSGQIGPEHAFFQFVAAGSALFSGSQSASARGFWQQYPSLLYVAAEARVVGPRCYEMLRGYGYGGAQRADGVPNPMRLLLPLPSAKQLARSDMPVNITPGPDKLAIRIGLLLCLSAGWPSFTRGRCTVFPASLITDGKAVSAGVRQHNGSVVGLAGALPHAEILRILGMEPEEQADALAEMAASNLTSAIQEFLLMPSSAGRAPVRIGFYATEENSASLRTAQLADMRETASSCAGTPRATPPSNSRRDETARARPMSERSESI